MKLKIFRVKIDNNPGEWKSGDDPTIFVLATSEEDAINKVKTESWGEKLDYDKKTLVYGANGYKPYTSKRSIISAIEVEFEGYEVLVGVQDIRRKKLENLNDL